MESRCEHNRLDLDVRRTRSMLLAGTAAFPMPFPSAGSISIEDGSFSFPPEVAKLPVEKGKGKGGGEKKKEKEDVTFVVVEEKPAIDGGTLRVIRQSDVTAIFFPGVWVDDKIFRFAEPDGVRDLDEGVWFHGSEVSADRIAARLKLDNQGMDIHCRRSGVRGIVFVGDERPVLTIHERVETANDTSMKIRGHCFSI